MKSPFGLLWIICLGTLFYHACSERISAGVKKDFTTGLTTTYRNLEPEKVMLAMNNEILNHTDIPLGETFFVINDEVKGFREESGFVKAGCELTVRDMAGNVLMHVNDLLEDKGNMTAEEAGTLHCSVSTGSPMQAGEKYQVYVRFWDKQGEGSIENETVINIIDEP